MKHKLLLLGAALSVSVSAMAQTFTATRPKLDAPVVSAWVPEDTVYLWNTGAKGFYVNHPGSGSPFWGTRAIVSATRGAKAIFTRHNPGGETLENWAGTGVNETTYLLVSVVSSKNNAAMATFTNGWNSIWTDNNTGNLRWFDVKLNSSNNTFKIEPNSTMLIDGASIEDAMSYNFAGKYLGVVEGDANLLVNLFDTSVDENEDGTTTMRVDPTKQFYSDWTCVKPADYESYFAVMGLYNAAESLKAAIQDAVAKYPGIKLDAQVAVYNNTAATVDELNAAAATIPDAIYQFIANTGTVANPADVSAKVVNGTFDVIGNFTGWTGNPNNFGAGGTTGPSAEHYGRAFNTYQAITGLKAGVYKLTAKAYFRKSSAVNDYTVWSQGTASDTKIYLNSKTFGKFSTPIQHIAAGAQASAQRGSTSTYDVTDASGSTLTVFMPNTMAEADLFFHNEDGSQTDLYNNEVLGALAEGDTLWIGAENTVGGSSDWSIFDDFKLYYLGSATDAYALLKSNAVASLAYEVPEETFYSAAAKATYDAAYASLQGASGEAAVRAVAPVQAAIDSLVASIDAYKTYMAKIQEMETWLTEGQEQGMSMEVDEVMLISDYLQLSAGDAEEGVYPNGVLNDIVNIEDGEYAGNLTTAQIKAETAYLTALFDEAVKKALLPGADLTSLIVNPGFEQGSSSATVGWKLDTSKGGTSGLTNWHGGNATNYCAEAYQQNFDVYQVVEGLPAGLYSVSVQAFYRQTWNQESYDAYVADPEMVGAAKVHTEVYFNEFSSPVKNVMEILYDENLGSNCAQLTNGKYCLNGMASASAAFSLEDEAVNFTQHVYGLVGADGKMRLGIRKLSGPTANGVWSLWDNFKITFMGKDVTAMKSVIENYQNRIAALALENAGVPDVEALTAANDAADQATGEDDTYEALQALVAAYNQVVASISTYNDLTTALNSLTESIETYAEASDEAIQNATDLIDEISDIVASKTLSGAEAAAYITKVNAAIADLRLPGNFAEASDENPVDFSSVIVNPTFDTIGNFTGWSSGFGAGGTTSTNAEVYNATSFNVYQDIVNLPVGVYEVRVNGFHRTGSASADYTDFKQYETAEVDPTLTAYLYGLDNPAVNSITTSTDHAATVPIKHLSTHADATNDRFATAASTSPAAYVPNTMAEADILFHDTDATGAPANKYLVSTFIKVTSSDGSGKGTLRIGVYKNDPSAKSTNWSIFDDFQLIYYGSDSQKTAGENAVNISDASATSAKAISTAIYTVGGARVAKLQKGVNIVKTVLSDGTVKTSKVLVK